MTFRALAFRQSEQRNCGSCVLISGVEKLSLLEKWSCEHKNKLLEREPFIGSMRVKSPELKDNL